MVDVADSKSAARKGVRVRVSGEPPLKILFAHSPVHFQSSDKIGMKILLLLTAFISTSVLAIRGETIQGHDLASTCKLTFYVKQDAKVLVGTCTGSFIGKKTFITAEHCFEDVAKNQELFHKKLIPDSSFFTCPGSDKKYEVQDLFPNKFSGLDEMQDMAIMKVKNDVDANPISLPKSPEAMELALIDKEHCYISGYGLDNEEKYGVLKTARLTQVDNRPLDLFNSGSRHRVRLSQNYADHGDSGGPLYCETDQGPVLIGVVHGGIQGTKFSDIEKLSITLDWISFHRDHGDKNEDMFKLVNRTGSMCKSLVECSEALKKINQLTTDTDKIMVQLMKQTQDQRTQILYGGEKSDVKLKDLWNEMIKQWEKNDCYNKLYP